MAPPTALTSTALAVGIFACLPGINGLLRPENALKTAMLPIPSNPNDRALVSSLVRMDAGRRLAAGLTNIALWYFGAFEVMGWCLVVGGPLVAGVDGWAARLAKSSGGGWEHWGFIPISVALGVALLKTA